MGSATTNFYNDAYQRAGFVDDARAIQSLWSQGKRDQAAARVPDEMITHFSAIGAAEMIKERIQRYQQAGIDCLGLRLDTVEPRQRVILLEQIVDIAQSL